MPLMQTAAACFVISIALAGCKDSGTNGTAGSGAAGETPRFVSLGTAPVGGAFYNVGAAIANALQGGRDAGGWRQVAAESTGGTLENLRRLDNGDIQLGMANSSITYFAVRGEEGFDKAYDVKSVMTLFPLIAMFVSKQGAGIESIEDLKGKRVVVGPQGAGFEYFVRPILREHGVNYGDFEDVYAGMQTSVGYLQDGSVAATFLGGGMVSPAITSAASSMDVYLVPYGDEQRMTLANKYPSFNEVTVPGGTYRGQPEDFAGLNVGSAHLLVRSDADEEFVYRVAKVIYEAREEIAESHAGGKSINPSNVVRDTGTEFHPGAIRYYRELGIWPEDTADPVSEDAASPTQEETTEKE
jgi:TRAP transporter TAXI family solute receptor